jgi:hypothetical protein
MKKILIFVLVICLYVGFANAQPDNQAFSKEHLTPTMYKDAGDVS